MARSFLDSVWPEGQISIQFTHRRVKCRVIAPPAQCAAAQSPTANNMNLVQNIKRLKLDVETIIPIHYLAEARKVTTAELMRAVGKGN